MFLTRCSSSKKSADHIHLLFLIKGKRWPHSLAPRHVCGQVHESFSIYGWWRHAVFLIKGKAQTTFICYSVLRNLRPTCLRASSWVTFYLWLMMSSAVGLFVHARVTSLFSISSCSVRLCDEFRCVDYLLCLFMSGRVSRDMGLVWFPISYFCVFCVLCVFMPGRVSRDMGLVWFPISYFIDLCDFCVALAETKESDQFRPSFLHYNIPLSLKLIILFCPASVTRV